MIHVIAPGGDRPETLRRILADGSAPCVVVDLSMGHVGAADSLRDSLSDQLSRRPEIEWFSGLELAEELADAAREAHVGWISEMSRMPVLAGRSVRRVLGYRDLLSLWWLLPATKHHPFTDPYSWLFYMLFVLERLRGEGLVGEWHIWGGDPDVVKVLADYLGTDGDVVRHAGAAPRERSGAAGAPRRLAGAVRLLVRSVLTGLRRRSDDVCPWSETRAPRVLIHSVLPQFWATPAEPADRPTPDACAFDRYFADLPWRLRESGFDVAWMPAFYAGDLARWKGLLARQDLPDVVPWMRLPIRRAAGLLLRTLGWAVACVLLFGVLRRDRVWRFRGVYLGEWLKRQIIEQATGGATAALVQLEQQRHACAALRPDVVLHRNEFLINGRIIDAACNGVAPTIGVQHGLLGRHVGVYQYARGDIQEQPGAWGSYDFIRHCPAPDVIAAFGEYYREYFERWTGFPGERIVPVGGVRHDRLVRTYLKDGRRDPRRRAAIRKCFGWPVAGEPVVLMCPTHPADAVQVFRTIVGALRRSGIAARIAVKPHPEHPVGSLVQEAAEALGWRDFEVVEGDVFPMIVAADVLVAGASTTILEAQLLDTPAISFGSLRYEVYPFREERIGYTASSEDDLAGLLAEILAVPASDLEAVQRRRMRALRRHLASFDGQAGRRLADLIRAVSGRDLTFVAGRTSYSGVSR